MHLLGELISESLRSYIHFPSHLQRQGNIMKPKASDAKRPMKSKTEDLAACPATASSLRPTHPSKISLEFTQIYIYIYENQPAFTKRKYTLY